MSSKIPLLFGAKPFKGLKGPCVPIHKGKWRVHGNHVDSRLVVIVDAPPYVLGRHEVNGGVDLEIEMNGSLFLEVLEAGKESSITVFLESL